MDLWVLETRTGALRQLTDDPAQDWDPGFTPDGRHVLWSSDRSGHLEIWIAGADGSGARQLTRDGVDAENPNATPDGRFIVYTSGNPQRLGLWRIRDRRDRVTSVSWRAPPSCPRSRPTAASCCLSPTRRDGQRLIQVAEIETGTLVPFEIEVTLAAEREQPDPLRTRALDSGRPAHRLHRRQRRGPLGCLRPGLRARPRHLGHAARAWPASPRTCSPSRSACRPTAGAWSCRHAAGVLEPDARGRTRRPRAAEALIRFFLTPPPRAGASVRSAYPHRKPSRRPLSRDGGRYARCRSPHSRGGIPRSRRRAGYSRCSARRPRPATIWTPSPRRSWPTARECRKEISC